MPYEIPRTLPSATVTITRQGQPMRVTVAPNVHPSTLLLWLHEQRLAMRVVGLSDKEAEARWSAPPDDVLRASLRGVAQTQENDPTQGEMP